MRLPSTATAAEIKLQYRHLSKKYHPDMGGSQASMAALNEAYQILSDPTRRSIYDAERRRAVTVPPRTPDYPVHPQPRRHQEPPTEYQFTRRQKPKQKASLWKRLVWGVAIIALGIGLVSRLPVAQAAPSGAQNTSTSAPPQTAYPNMPSTSSSQSSPSGAPDVISYNQSSTQHPTSTRPSKQPSDDCSDSLSSDACQSRAQEVCASSAKLHKDACTQLNSSCLENAITSRQYMICD